MRAPKTLWAIFDEEDGVPAGVVDGDGFKQAMDEITEDGGHLRKCSLVTRREEGNGADLWVLFDAEGIIFGCYEDKEDAKNDAWGPRFWTKSPGNKGRWWCEECQKKHPSNYNFCPVTGKRRKRAREFWPTIRAYKFDGRASA